MIVFLEHLNLRKQFFKTKKLVGRIMMWGKSNTRLGIGHWDTIYSVNFSEMSSSACFRALLRDAIILRVFSAGNFYLLKAKHELRVVE